MRPGQHAARTPAVAIAVRHRRGSHQATRLPVSSASSAQAAGGGLLAEPVGELALGLGERLAEVAARGRRPPDRRQVGPHPLEVVGGGHAPIQRSRRAAAPPARRARGLGSEIPSDTGRHGVPGGRTAPAHGPRLQRRAGRPGRRRPRAGQRGARAERRVQPGLGVPRARHARTTYAGSGRPPPTTSTSPTAGWPG